MTDRLDNYRQLLKSGLITKDEFEFYKARYEAGAFNGRGVDESRFRYAREGQNQGPEISSGSESSRAEKLRRMAEAAGAKRDDDSDITFERSAGTARDTNVDDEFCREENGGGNHMPHPGTTGRSADNGDAGGKILAIILLLVFWPAGIIYTLVKRPFGAKGQIIALVVAAVMAFGTVVNVMEELTSGPDRFPDRLIREIEEMTGLFDDGDDDPGQDPVNGSGGAVSTETDRWYDSESGIYYYGTPDVDASALTEGQKDALDKAEWALSSYPYSREGLKMFLDSFGLTDDEIEFALDHCGADWYQEAIWQAEEVYGDQNDVNSMEVRYFLEIYEYTDDQIDYALKYAAIDWEDETQAA